MKKSTSRHAEAPPCRRVTEFQLVEMHDKMDKMVEWMVPKSTGQVEPHIAGRFGSMQV